MSGRALQGVVVGCDLKQEWMLPWWFMSFRAHNTEAIAFIDFGMTPHARQWCMERGVLISLEAPRGFVFPKSQIAAELVAQWEGEHGPLLWSARAQWFNKPFALLQSPFEKSIWLDLDCEVLGSLSALYQKIHHHSGIALATDTTQGNEGYSSGVIVFDIRSQLLVHWALLCVQNNHHFLGDQQVLTHLIQEGHVEVSEIPCKYNWVIKNGINADAVVLHWSGFWGKKAVRSRIGANTSTGKS